MAPFPETAGLLALRGPAALHLAGWLVTAASLFVPLAVWDERRRAERRAELREPPHRRCLRKPT